jgi:hypothetical protein
MPKPRIDTRPLKSGASRFFTPAYWSSGKLKHLKVIVLLLLIIAALVVTQLNLLPGGISLSPRMRAINRLKNRTQPPQEFDFNKSVTLPGLLQPGDDRARWSEASAGRVEGFVVRVMNGSVESSNCYSLLQRDTHIEVALRQDAAPRERVELEVTPRLRQWARGQGWDWSTRALESELVGHWCQFEGWLLFDINHDDESENTAPESSRNWRATAWELHPVTSIKVIR